MLNILVIKRRLISTLHQHGTDNRGYVIEPRLYLVIIAQQLLQ